MKKLNKLGYKHLLKEYDAQKQYMQYCAYGTKDTWYMQMIEEELNKREGVDYE